MEDNVKSFLDQIQELKEKKIKVVVPSTGQTVDCSPLSFKQQKDLISTIADGPIGALKFQKILNDMIVDNTGNTDINSTDRLAIILALRLDSIGDTVKIGDDEVLISPILERAKVIKQPHRKIIKGVVDVVLETPTLQYESRIIQSAIDTLKKGTNAEISKNVGSVYTYEIVKYIKSVKFGESELIFADIPIQDRVKIVDNLPVAINKNIISFIQDIKKKERAVLEVTVNGVNKYLDIDTGFFDS